VVGSHLHEVEDVIIVITLHRWPAWSWEAEFAPELSAAGSPMDDPGRCFVF
jgi:hypothetical protein